MQGCSAAASGGRCTRVLLVFRSAVRFRNTAQMDKTDKILEFAKMYIERVCKKKKRTLDEVYYCKRWKAYNAAGEKINKLDPVKQYGERSVLAYKQKVILQEFEELRIKTTYPKYTP